MKNILTVNIGNTSCSFVLFSSNEISFERKFPIKDLQKSNWHNEDITREHREERGHIGNLGEWGEL